MLVLNDLRWKMVYNLPQKKEFDLQIKHGVNTPAHVNPKGATFSTRRGFKGANVLLALRQ